ncbi:MAG: GH3 auxin-responsive promoter family protein [Bdellovibrionales bacterium]|nr:GH3 auxin-responsive promoter family protein [Bdellovibrionales bacterium]
MPGYRPPAQTRLGCIVERCQQTTLTYLVRTFVKARGQLLLARQKRRARDVERVQDEVLRSIVAGYRGTELGDALGLGEVWSSAAFKERVRINDYERLRPWIRKQLEQGGMVVSRSEPVAYNVTSGTTGEPKYLPVTRQTLRWTRDAQMLTAYGLLQSCPGVLDGKILGIVSAPCERYSPRGVPIGSKSGQVYENVGFALRSKYVVPPSVFGIDDYVLKYLLVLRLALMHRDVTYIQTANTSTLSVIAELMNEHWDELLSDLAHGGFFRWDELPAQVQRNVIDILVPFPARAHELRRIEKERSPATPLRLADIFPALRAVGCWKSGSAGIFLQRAALEFDATTALRDVGYIASELHGTTPVNGDGTDAFPTFENVYFEFVPRKQWDTGERHAEQTFGLHQLTVGQQYYVLITTTDGLVRYDMNDILEVTGYYHGLPTLRFVQKGSGVTNLTGEKLSEHQVVRAVAQLEAEQQLRSVFYLMVADERAGRYRLYYEPVSDSRAQVERFLKSYSGRLDKYIAFGNIEYAQKRQSNRLQCVEICSLQPGTFERFRQHWVATGRREGQFKIVALRHRWEAGFPFESFVAATPALHIAPRTTSLAVP